MADKRMFSLKIVDSDLFLDMPLSSQCLYFHLSMRADDDGFVDNPKKIIKIIGANDDDLKILITMVLSILRDPVYCGNMERNKRPTLSFKNRKRLYVPKEDRIVVKDTHEGIVSEEVWTQVQQMLDKRKNTNKSGIAYDNIFKGLVKCPDCNYALTPKKDYRLNKKDTIDFVHFSCSGYKKYGVKACTSHRINARDLYDVVLEDIQYHGQMALSSREDFVMKIAEKIDKDKVDERKDKTEKLNSSKIKLKDLDKAFEKLYEDRLSESISERNFNLMNEKLSRQQEKLIEEIRT